MTRKECFQFKKEKGHWPENYIENKKAAYKRFEIKIRLMKEKRPGVTIHLHHCKFNDPDYEKWLDVTPMYIDEHQKHHCKNLTKEQKQMLRESFLKIQYKVLPRQAPSGHFFRKECPEGAWRGKTFGKRNSRKKEAHHV